jgi:hypothetical protein
MSIKLPLSEGFDYYSLHLLELVDGFSSVGFEVLFRIGAIDLETGESRGAGGGGWGIPLRTFDLGFGTLVRETG